MVEGYYPPKAFQTAEKEKDVERSESHTPFDVG
jgi:hypothetical protein